MKLKVPNAKQIQIILIIIACAFVPYWPVLSADFTNWDDHTYVWQNPKLEFKSENLPYHLHKLFIPGSCELTKLSMTATHSIWGMDPTPYHAINLVLHVINSLLVFLLIQALFRKTSLSLVTALLFAVHPLHVESVAWVAERKDVQYSMFFLLSLLSYIKSIHSEKRRFAWLSGSLLLFILSVMSKGQGIALPFTLVAVDFIIKREIPRSRWLLEKGLFFAVTFYALAPKAGIPRPELFPLDKKPVKVAEAPDLHPDQDEPALKAIEDNQGEGALPQLQARKKSVGGYSTPERLIIASFAYFWYPMKLVLPGNLSVMYGYPFKAGESIPPWLWLFPLGLAGLAFYWFKHFRQKKEFVFIIFFYTACIFLTLQIIPVTDSPYNDRYAYMASIAFCLAVAIGVEKLKKSSYKKFVTPGLVLLLAALGAGSWDRCKIWKDSLSLWTDLVEKQPGSVLGYCQRADIYMVYKDHVKAARDYENAIRINGSNFAAHYNLGKIAEKNSDWEQAEYYYKNASMLSPSKHYPHNSLGVAMLKNNNQTDAIKSFLKAIDLKENYPKAYYNLGVAYMDIKNYETAVKSLKHAIALSPDYQKANYNLANTYASMEKWPEARDAYLRTLEISPYDPGTMVNLGNVYVRLGKFNDAVKMYKDVLRLDPQNKNASKNLAAIEKLTG